MCGIAGIFNIDRDHKIDKEILIRITEKLAHRGPDDSRYFINGNIGFGFKRLSLIDLENGGQPMSNEDGTVTSVCNGEIFNYDELKKKLVVKGHVLRTGGDCEILPHLYEEYGMGMLDHLNGQFALAIYDATSNRLHIARDQFGINPLFYTYLNNTFVFASEIKAIIEYPGVERQVDLVGLDQVFCFPGIISPRTIFKQIHSLETGHYLSVDNDRKKSQEYWDINYPICGEIGQPRDEKFYVDQLTEHLLQSVSLRLRADVDTGLYLSGGLDSSLIASLAGTVAPQTRRHTFSVSFPGQEICESNYQVNVVRRIRSVHHEVPFDSNDVVKLIEKAVYYAESPLKETYDTACFALSSCARASNTPVILTGEGADEMFAGYIGYRFDSFKTKCGQSRSTATSREEEIREQLWGDRSLAYDNNYSELEEAKQHFYSARAYARLQDVNAFSTPIINAERIAGRELLHKRSYLDFKLRLADHLLSDHGDRMAMAHGVELRHPFLDLNVMNCVLRIPPCLKLKAYREKYILKEVARPYVDAEIIEREKFGWYAPGSPVLVKKHEEWMQDMLSSERIKRQGYFNYQTMERLKGQYAKEDFVLNQPFEGDLLMIVLTFSILLDIFALPECN